MEIINVLYIHGLGSSKDSSTGRLLAGLSSDEIIFHNPSFSLSPKKAMEEVNDYIDKNNIDIVIGSSLGGFYAIQSNCDYGVVINPALSPIEDIKNAIGYGEHPLVNGEGNYTIDDHFFDELNDIIKMNYPNSDVDKWYLDFDKKRLFAGIFGAKDELFSHFNDFNSINSKLNILIDDMPHRFQATYLNVYKLLSLLDKIIKGVKASEKYLRVCVEILNKEDELLWKEFFKKFFPNHYSLNLVNRDLVVDTLARDAGKSYENKTIAITPDGFGFISLKLAAFGGYRYIKDFMDFKDTSCYKSIVQNGPSLKKGKPELIKIPF